MITVGQIATKAFDKVASKISGVILDAELFEKVKGTYDSATGTHPETEETRGACRAIMETQKPIGDVFPDYTAGPGEMLFFLEGISNVPQENWILRIAGQPDRTITKAQDILLAGAIAYVVAR